MPHINALESNSLLAHVEGSFVLLIDIYLLLLFTSSPPGLSKGGSFDAAPGANPAPGCSSSCRLEVRMTLKE